MEVFVMIRRQKTTIFADAKETSTVYDLKRTVEGILNKTPEEQKLYKDDTLLEDSKTLAECGFNQQNSGPEIPATIGLALATEDENFEQLQIEPFSTPPDAP